MGEAWEGLSHLVPRGAFFVETPDMESYLHFSCRGQNTEVPRPVAFLEPG